MPIYESKERPPVHSSIYNFVDHLIPYLLSNTSPERSLALVIADRNNDYISTAPIIYYNIEQLTRKTEFNRVIDRLHEGDIIEIWDYSTANIKILHNAGFTNVRHVPVSTIPETVTSLSTLYQSSHPVFDLAFCGAISPRRQTMLDSLIERGVTINIISNSTKMKWGIERDREIARCRALLNIHFADDYTVFESVRCDPWVSAGMPVITETSIDDDSRCAVIAPYGELVERTIEFLRRA